VQELALADFSLLFRKSTGLKVNFDKLMRSRFWLLNPGLD